MKIQTIIIIVATIASIFLGAVSNWIYHLLRSRGYFPDKPGLKGIAIVIFVSLPFVIVIVISEISNEQQLDLRSLVQTPFPLWIVITIAIFTFIFGYVYRKEIENIHSDYMERIIYDATVKCKRIDFRDKPGQVWNNETRTHVGPIGEGNFSVDEQKGILTVNRELVKAGRYEIWLERYNVGNHISNTLGSNVEVAGGRILHLTCEAKVDYGEHSLKFHIKEVKGNKIGDSLAYRKKRITQNHWTPIDFVFAIPASKECVLRIDDEEVTRLPSNLLIRGLKLTERL